MTEENIHPVDLHVGRRLRFLRKRAGISQEKLGGYGNITFQQVQKYERGANRLSASMMWTFARALRISVSDFFEGLPEGKIRRRDAAEEAVVAFLATPDGYDVAKAASTISPPVLRAHLALMRASGPALPS